MSRRLAAGALLAIALTGLLAAWQPGSAAPAAAATTPTCTSRQLSLRLSPDTHDATQRYRFVVLSDTGGRCVLRGRPAVSLEHRGRQVGVRGDYFPYSADGGAPDVRTVTLAHRGAASIWLAVAVAGGTGCRSQPVDGFLLRLPHQHVRQVGLPDHQRRSYAVCASRTSHELAFSQFLAGAVR